MSGIIILLFCNTQVSRSVKNVWSSMNDEMRWELTLQFCLAATGNYEKQIIN